METLSRETLDPSYVTGFADGEGTFTYSRNGRQMALYFAIKITAVDRPVLEEIQQFFSGVGTIYDVAGRPPTKAAAYYRVSRVDELRVVVEHFDAYPLRTKKRDTYAIWRRMFLAKENFRNPDRARLNELAEELSASCARNQPWR